MPNLDLTLLLGRDWLCHISKAYEAAERTINAVSGHRKFRYVRSRMHHYFKAGTVRINIVSAITEVALLMISSSRSSRHKQSWLAVVTNVPCRYGDLKAGISSKQSDCLEGLLANQEFWRMRGSGAHWMQQYPLSLFRTVYPGRGTRMCLPGSRNHVLTTPTMQVFTILGKFPAGISHVSLKFEELRVRRAAPICLESNKYRRNLCEHKRGRKWVTYR
jgi:hypothetical protein